MNRDGTANGSKNRWFVVETLHAMPSTFFMYGVPFYASARLGWSDGQNLLTQALAGLCVAIGAFAGGQWAHRQHPGLPIRAGMLLGAFGSLTGLAGVLLGLHNLAGLLLLVGMAVVSFAQALVWPALEAEIMDGEPPARVQNFVGVYNLVWSLATATAFLIATPLFGWTGLNTLFVLPAAFYLGNLTLLLSLSRPASPAGGETSPPTHCWWRRFASCLRPLKRSLRLPVEGSAMAQHDPSAGKSDGLETEMSTPLSPLPFRGGVGGEAALASPFPASEAMQIWEGIGGDAGGVRQDNLTPAHRASFRVLGWLANPFAYVAINVIVAYNPTIGLRLGLSKGAVSVYCGLWFYVRTLAFELLRRWTWWQYRWGLLGLAFVLMMASFAAIVAAPTLPILLLAQLVFGLTIGLMYQSSLFYAMAGSEAQGAHGGWHESFIGLGIMAGPLLAWVGTQFFPAGSIGPLVLVLALMSGGLAALVTVGSRIRGLNLPG